MSFSLPVIEYELRGRCYSQTGGYFNHSRTLILPSSSSYYTRNRVFRFYCSGFETIFSSGRDSQRKNRSKKLTVNLFKDRSGLYLKYIKEEARSCLLLDGILIPLEPALKLLQLERSEGLSVSTHLFLVSLLRSAVFTVVLGKRKLMWP